MLRLGRGPRGCGLERQEAVCGEGLLLGSGVSSTAKSWDVSRGVCVGSEGGRKTWWRQAGDGSEQPHVGPEVA